MKIIRLKTANGHISQKRQEVRPGSWDPRSSLKILEDQRFHSYRTYIFQVDVRVLWVVWVSVPGPIIWCSAPAVPVLMLTTVGYGTRLQRKTAFIAQTLACRSGCLPIYFIMLQKRLSSRNTVIFFIIINHLPGRNYLIIFYIITKMELFY